MPDDMRIPIRTDSQIALDREQTRDQVRQLGAPRRGFTTNPGLGEVLRRKHVAAEDPLQFDIVRSQGDGEAFVVSRHLLVPDTDRRDEADEGLKERGFARRGLSDDDAACAVLHDLVWVYTFETGSDEEARDQVDQALALLTSQGIAAARHMVTAEQIVHKSEDGPAPTSVTIYPFPKEGAALPSSEEAIVVAVIDTGIDEPLRGDGWLNEVVRENNDANVDKLDVFAPVGAMMPVLDYGAGHGTFAAGIVRQVDPLAEIVVYRALNTNGLGSEEAVACAMIRAAQAGAHVISLSLGMEAVDEANPCPALQAAVQHIRSQDNPPVIVAAAGNNGNTEKVYPAALEGVVAVAALRAVKDPRSSQPWPVPKGAKWSSRGDWVSCSTVGEGIVSTFVEGEEDPTVGRDVYPQDSWAVWSGTSFAAPQIAALIATMCREDMSPQEAVTALLSSANPPTDGYGERFVLLPGTRPSP